MMNKTDKTITRDYLSKWLEAEGIDGSIPKGAFSVQLCEIYFGMRSEPTIAVIGPYPNQERALREIRKLGTSLERVRSFEGLGEREKSNKYVIAPVTYNFSDQGLSQL
jgi:hypothetical protein